LQIETKIVSSHTADFKPVKQEIQQYSDASSFSIPWANTIFAGMAEGLGQRRECSWQNN